MLIDVGTSNLKIEDDADQQISTDDFIVPFEQNPRFTGRREFLEILKGKLFEQAPKKYNHRIALYGMGGIGKTQTALEYVYTNRDSYDRVYWITAVDQASLLSGYLKIATMAGLKTQLHPNPVEIAKGVLSWLHQKDSWLIVIDNLDDIDVATGFLPQNGLRKHTLITTRNPNSTGIPAEGLEVPLLDTADSIELLSTLSNIEIIPNSHESVQASQIVEELGHLPLGIEQAAAYVREVAGNFAIFLDDYHENHKDVHQWVAQGYRQYSHSIATTWFMSFNIVRKTNPRAATLFQILSFLNPDGVLIGFLQSAIKGFPDDLQEVMSSRINISKALIELEKFSLLKWNRVNKMVIIHRLVQAVIRDEMAEEERKMVSATVINICDESFPKEWNNDTRDLCRNYFGQVLVPLLSVKSERLMKLAEIMSRVGNFLEKDGRYNDSAKLLKEAFEIYSALHGPDDLFTLISLNELASVYRRQGKLTDARKMQEELLAKFKVILSDDHPNTLAVMQNLAMTYRQQGKLTEAAKMNENVLEKCKVILGDDHPDTLISMHSLAETYREQGKLTEAAKMHEEVLAKRQAILGDDHLDTLTSTYNLAFTYRQQGRLTEAANMHEDELAKCKMTLGDDHPETLISMHNLALMYGQQGKLTEATKMHEEVLAKRQIILGDNHPSTLTSMYNLALEYGRQGKLTEAAKMYEKVLAKYKVVLGDDHLSALACMENLAETYRRQEKLTEAAKMCENVLAKYRVVSGDDHPSTIANMHNLAKIYRQQGKLEESTKMLEKALVKYNAIFGGNHPLTFICMTNLALTYGEQGKLTEAAKIHEEILAKYKTILGDDHPLTLTNIHSLALMYGQQGKLTETVKLFEEVLATRRKILGDDHPETLMTLYNLAETYGHQGKLTEAAKLLEEMLGKCKAIYGDDHPSTVKTTQKLAEIYGQPMGLTETTKMHENMILEDNHHERLGSVDNSTEMYVCSAKEDGKDG